MKNNFIKKVIEKIKIGEANSPILFSAKNLELLNKEVENISYNLLKEFWVPNINLFVLKDNWEKIKIEEIKKFLELWNSTTSYAFQIFFIENISRMTLQASNSCLKFFEEPWNKNIIFLTNKGEAWVIDTILSRVQFVDLWWAFIEAKDDFFYSMIESYLNWNKDLINYFFKNKLEKSEYLRFLQTLIVYIKQSLVFINFLDELEDDINSLANNNVNPRWLVDKWILKLK